MPLGDAMEKIARIDAAMDHVDEMIQHAKTPNEERDLDRIFDLLHEYKEMCKSMPVVIPKMENYVF